MNTQQKALARPSFGQALRRSSLAFLAMVPLLLGIIGLVGIVQTLLTPQTIATLFRGNALLDTLIGTGSGAFASGNPIVSYLLGGELLKKGVSLYAVTAFILSWVTLGVVHLPAEAEIFGRRFTLYRNVLALCFTMLIAVATALTVQLLS